MPLGTLTSSLAGWAAQEGESSRKEAPASIQECICVFTDSLDGLRLGPRDLARALKELGIAGVGWESGFRRLAGSSRGKRREDALAGDRWFG